MDLSLREGKSSSCEVVVHEKTLIIGRQSFYIPRKETKIAKHWGGTKKSLAYLHLCGGKGKREIDGILVLEGWGRSSVCSLCTNC